MAQFLSPEHKGSELGPRGRLKTRVPFSFTYLVVLVIERTLKRLTRLELIGEHIQFTLRKKFIDSLCGIILLGFIFIKYYRAMKYLGVWSISDVYCLNVGHSVYGKAEKG